MSSDTPTSAHSEAQCQTLAPMPPCSTPQVLSQKSAAGTWVGQLLAQRSDLPLVLGQVLLPSQRPLCSFAYSGCGCWHIWYCKWMTALGAVRYTTIDILNRLQLNTMVMRRPKRDLTSPPLTALESFRVPPRCMHYSTFQSTSNVRRVHGLSKLNGESTSFLNICNVSIVTISQPPLHVRS